MEPRPRGRTPYRWPTAIERAYVRQLLRRTSTARDLVHDHLLPTLARLAPEIDARARVDSTAWRFDAAPGDLGQLLRVVETVRRAFGIAFEPNTERLADTAGQVALFNAHVLEQHYPAVHAIAVGNAPQRAAELAAWTRDNVALIRSIDQRYFDDLQRVITDALTKGTQTREIRQLIEARYQVSRSRAELIARDQIGKLNGKITQGRQTRAGLLRYRWISSHDERVRPTHRLLDGTIQLWSEPPVSEANGDRNHPGQAVLCRCIAQPYFGDEEEDYTPFASPRLSAARPTIYGSRENPLSAAESADLQRRLGR